MATDHSQSGEGSALAKQWRARRANMLSNHRSTSGGSLSASQRRHDQDVSKSLLRRCPKSSKMLPPCFQEATRCFRTPFSTCQCATYSAAGVEHPSSYWMQATMYATTQAVYAPRTHMHSLWCVPPAPPNLKFWFPPQIMSVQSIGLIHILHTRAGVRFQIDRCKSSKV